MGEQSEPNSQTPRARLNEVEINDRLRALDPDWAEPPPSRFAREIKARDVNALLVKLGDSDPHTRTEAAAALAEVGSVKAAGGLKALLNDPFPPVRQAAAAALIAMGDEAMSREFIKALEDPNPRVVAGAASALGHAGRKEAVGPLLQAFRTEDPLVASAIAKALGRLGNTEAVPWLSAALRANIAAAECAEALGRLKDGSSARLLVDALRHPDAEVRAACARSLGMLAGADSKSFDFVLRDQKVIPALSKAARDPSRKVRVCAALALHELGEQSAPAALAAALEG